MRRLAWALAVLLCLASACSWPGGTSQDGEARVDQPEVDEPEVDEPDTADLIAFVEEARGLEFVEPVEVEMVDDEEFERRLAADLEEERAAVAQAEPRFRAIGIIGPDVDLFDALASLLGSAAVGFYDPEAGELVVRGTGLSEYAREVVVHELTHALDDQHFDIGDEVAPWSDDAGLAVLSAIEGSAERVRTAYIASMTEEDQQASAREQLRLAGRQMEAVLALPRRLVELLAVPYRRGLTFASAVVEAEGRSTLDAALDDAPPASMEQILRPEAYLEGEAPLDVEAPVAGGDIVEEGVLGEHYLRLMLRTEGDAAEGWGGDRFVAWTDGARSCLRVAVVGDTPQDTAELRDAGLRWAQDGDREATDDGGLVTLTSCA